MRRLVVGLAVGIGLIGTTPASAATPAQVVSKRLAQVYGVAWRNHTPSWSKPECRVISPQHICMTEFAHAGTWYIATMQVTGRKTKFLFRRHWTRRWREATPDCIGSTRLEGTLSSNDGACDVVVLGQNWGNGEVIRYTGFKKTILYYGTDSALWPDFNRYRCTYSGATLQCLNRFGDGFRWATAPTTATPSEFVVHLSSGFIGCALGPASQLVCIGSPPGNDPLQQVAELATDGTLKTCTRHAGSGACFQGDFGENPPTRTPGQSVTIGQFACQVSETGVQCQLGAGGKGFTITPQQITPVG
jgi:hypothetical protein